MDYKSQTHQFKKALLLHVALAGKFPCGRLYTQLQLELHQ